MAKKSEIIDYMKREAVYAVCNYSLTTAACNIRIMSEVCHKVCNKYGLTIAELDAIVSEEFHCHVIDGRE